MERLTHRDDQGMARIGFGGLVPTAYESKAAIDRLAAYEDTGLTPEEIERILDAYGRGMTMRTENAERLRLVKDISTDRLKNIAEAEQDGRLVELPCKKGDTLWAYYNYPTTGIRKMVATDVSTLNGKIVINTDAYGVISESDIGKTVFLTRQEAEAAVEAAKTTKEEI